MKSTIWYVSQKWYYYVHSTLFTFLSNRNLNNWTAIMRKLCTILFFQHTLCIYFIFITTEMVAANFVNDAVLFYKIIKKIIIITCASCSNLQYIIVDIFPNILHFSHPKLWFWKIIKININRNSPSLWKNIKVQLQVSPWGTTFMRC